MSLKDREKNKGEMDRGEGESERERGAADGLFTEDTARTKDLNFRESCVYTHTSKPVIKARDKVLFC